jgi:hypothetical protein
VARNPPGCDREPQLPQRQGADRLLQEHQHPRLARAYVHPRAERQDRAARPVQVVAIGVRGSGRVVFRVPGHGKHDGAGRDDPAPGLDRVRVDARQREREVTIPAQVLPDGRRHQVGVVPALIKDVRQAQRLERHGLQDRERGGEPAEDRLERAVHLVCVQAGLVQGGHGARDKHRVWRPAGPLGSRPLGPHPGHDGRAEGAQVFLALPDRSVITRG